MADLGPGPYAVRSTATAEDLPGHSFAGQHGTFFTSKATRIPDLVRHCWASLWTDRAFAYRARHGFDHHAADMAVIVQQLVPAGAAGVCFTADPVTGEDRIVVEACPGLGETLVAGKASPDRFVLAREGRTLLDAHVETQTTEVIVGDDGKVVERAVPQERGSEPVIDAETLARVVELALSAERLLGGPQDVEWAAEGDEVWLLQSRPVTTAHRMGADHEADATIWSNVNTGEILPDVITPMTWSIIFGNANEIFYGLFAGLGIHIDATKLIGLVGGRVYFNLSLIRDAFARIPAASVPDVDALLGGMHEYVELPELEEPPGPGARAWLSMAAAIPGIAAWFYRHTPKKAEAFRTWLRGVTDDARERLDADPSEDQCAALLRDLVSGIGAMSDALAFAGVAMTGYSNLALVCKRWLGDETGALTNKLVSGRGDVLSAEAGLALWELAAFAREHPPLADELTQSGGWEELRALLEVRAAKGDADAERFLERWDAFMDAHGHHARGELDFATPRWDERPDYVLGIVNGYLETAPDPDPARLYEQRTEEAHALARECRTELRNPAKRRVFDSALRKGRESAVLRENVKSDGIRWIATIRRALLALGRRLAARGVIDRTGDVFFLEWEELEPVRRGRAGFDVRDRIAERRSQHERDRALAPPPVVVGEWDAEEADWTIGRDVDTLSGLGVSAGVARGPARVLASHDADEPVRPGEILVAPFTDPGWTPYFVPAAGIVMDMGGMLSHGSIIAREYGIPAVVNVGPATSIIQTGQFVEVDGDAGIVRIMD